jgi:hypothetical protein
MPACNYRFRDSQLDLHEIFVRKDVEWREPFVSRTASEIFNNYDLKIRHPQRRTPKLTSDKSVVLDRTSFSE